MAPFKDQDCKHKDRIVCFQSVLLEHALKDLESAGCDVKQQQQQPGSPHSLPPLSKLSRGGAGAGGIPYRQPRLTLDLCDVPFQPWSLRNGVLCQLLAAGIVLLVLIQALSCGLFFCVAMPSPTTQYMDLRDLFTEFALIRPAAQPARLPDPPPMLIPRIIHQTYRTKVLPEKVRSFMHSWVDANPAWQVRFYDDMACTEFVRREFPEYLDAYVGLPKDVERSDFFRYLVVLRNGGVYADIDVECRQPLDGVLLPTDTLVTGWESEVPSDALAFKRHHVRRRQVLQWFFAAAPGHPVLRSICDHIAANVRTRFSNNTNRDTLERTGPGAWTDAVLRHALQHNHAQVRAGARDYPCATASSASSSVQHSAARTCYSHMPTCVMALAVAQEGSCIHNRHM